MTSHVPRPERKPFIRKSVALIPICPVCKKQDYHAPFCDNDGFVTGVYDRTDTFIRFDRSPGPLVSVIKFSYSADPTNWQSSPDGKTIQYFDDLASAGEGWKYLKMMVEGVGR